MCKNCRYPYRKVEMLVYCLSGLLAAFAGVMMACKLASFQASIGESWQMDSITAQYLVVLPWQVVSELLSELSLVVS